MNIDRARLLFDLSVWTLGAAFSLFLVVDAVASDRVPAAPPNAAYSAECGSCHIAYPPRFLAAPGWTAILQDTSHHFGVDASVDPAVNTAIRTYLETNAASPGQKRHDPAATRITDTRWFRKEHAEIGAGVFQRTGVKSPANCAACHPAAERGLFNEHDVRIPRT